MNHSTFFTRKKFVTVLCLVLGVYTAIWGFVLLGNKLENNRKVSRAKAEQAKIQSLSKEEQAIRKGQTYLVNNLSNIRPEQRLFLDYMQRRFKLDERLSASKSPIAISENPKIYPTELNFLARIAYPDKLVPMQPRNAVDGATLTNIYSANCDHLAVPNSFWPTMEQNSKAGGYYSTHNALAFAFMKDNACPVPAKDAELLAKTMNDMVAIADDPANGNDLRYEAIAFLGLSGRSDLINESWAEKIVGDQKEDGSWIDDQNPKEIDHTTVLALWALLEYSRPNTPYEALIHRPTQQP